MRHNVLMEVLIHFYHILSHLQHLLNIAMYVHLEGTPIVYKRVRYYKFMNEEPLAHYTRVLYIPTVPHMLPHCLFHSIVIICLSPSTFGITWKPLLYFQRMSLYPTVARGLLFMCHFVLYHEPATPSHITSFLFGS